MMPLRCIEIACDALRCIFHFDFVIAQPFIIRFANGLQHCDGNVISFRVICESKLSVKYF